MSILMSTREVADYLKVNQKMIYTLVAEKELPATKVTGKWLFPRHLVQQWVENSTINFPEPVGQVSATKGTVVLAGSNDVLLEQTMALYNREYQGRMAVFANVGSMGGIHALRRNLCHIAPSHLLEEGGSGQEKGKMEYNFHFAWQELKSMPVVVNFCRRRQGLLYRKDNPLGISGIADLGKPGLRLVNRPLGTGTRLLLDNLLQEQGLSGEKIKGYGLEVGRHLDVGLEILANRADVGPGIEAIAGILDLGFLPLHWERFDLLISRAMFFERTIQHFLGILEHQGVAELAAGYRGYDLSLAGKMIFQGEE
nr:helix-turn-helix transcriptional regulator [Desulfogranum mediterraneum]